jgi:lysophospholipase L1-like esterase
VSLATSLVSPSPRGAKVVLMTRTKATALAVVAALLGVLFSATGSAPAAQTRTQTCQPTPEGTALKIAIMGDSISTPLGASVPERSWPVMLQTQGATHGWGVTLNALGATHAGEYVPGGNLNWVAQNVRASQPDIVTMNFRTNEQVGFGQSPAQLKANLLALMDFIRAESPNTRFVMINPPIMFYHVFNTTPATQADYIRALWEAGNERGACWVDLKPFFPTSGPDARSRVFLPDDIHPGDIGHAVFFAAIYTALLQACGLR